MQGDLTSAARDCRDDSNWMMNLCLAIADHTLGKMTEAQAQPDKMHAELGKHWAINYAEVYGQWGKTNEALHWLETAYDLHDAGLVARKADWMLDPVRQTPRFKAIQGRLNFPP
jgi:hypothetical protein